MIQFFPSIKNDISVKRAEIKPYTNNPFRLRNQPGKDTVSFKSIFRITEISGIPSAYSRIIMVSSKEQKEFGLLISALRGEGLQKELDTSFKKRRHSLEKTISKILIQKSKEYPDKNVQELLQQMAPMAEKRIAPIQLRILKAARKEAKRGLEGKTQDIVLENLKKARTAILLNNEHFFKRKKIIDSIKDISKAEKNQNNHESLQNITEILLKLPNSRNHQDSFIVKYQRRSSREIGEKLIEPYTSTKEHIIPSNDQGGFLAVMAMENWERSDEPFHELVIRRPKIVRNIIHQFNVIEQKIRHGEIADPNNYLYETSEKLYTASDHFIDLHYKKTTKPPIQNNPIIATAIKETGIKTVNRSKKLPENTKIPQPKTKTPNTFIENSKKTYLSSEDKLKEQSKLKEKQFRSAKRVEILAKNLLQEEENNIVLKDLDIIRTSINTAMPLKREQISNPYIKWSDKQAETVSSVLKQMEKHFSELKEVTKQQKFKKTEKQRLSKEEKTSILLRTARKLIKTKILNQEHSAVEKDLATLEAAIKNNQTVKPEEISSPFINTKKELDNHKILRQIVINLSAQPNAKELKANILSPQKNNRIQIPSSLTEESPDNEIIKFFEASLKKLRRNATEPKIKRILDPKTNTRKKVKIEAPSIKDEMINSLKNTKAFLEQQGSFGFNSPNFINYLKDLASKDSNVHNNSLYRGIITNLSKLLNSEKELAA